MKINGIVSTLATKGNEKEIGRKLEPETRSAGEYFHIKKHCFRKNDTSTVGAGSTEFISVALASITTAEMGDSQGSEITLSAVRAPPARPGPARPPARGSRSSWPGPGSVPHSVPRRGPMPGPRPREAGQSGPGPSVPTPFPGGRSARPRSPHPHAIGARSPAPSPAPIPGAQPPPPAAGEAGSGKRVGPPGDGPGRVPARCR